MAAKRKRVEVVDPREAKRQSATKSNTPKARLAATSSASEIIPNGAHKNGAHKATTEEDDTTYDPASTLTVQIVTGDYERITHGLAAAIPAVALSNKDSDANITFSETFLFTAHTASVRCLAISPKTENDKRFLATGSADERINVYSISTAPPRPSTTTLNGAVIAENANNRSLGSLTHHDRAVARLTFPAKGKLFSAAEDNTIAISRTRDWTMLSSIKAPIPKVQGRPSGDTAAPGEVPTGVNDFAIHPSQKLMLSAGVLNFDRELLNHVGEGKHSSGEGRRVTWDDAGEQYVYAIMPALQEAGNGLLAISTEDGRILFYDISEQSPAAGNALPQLGCVAQLGGKSAGVSSRIKDFIVLPVPSVNAQAPAWLVVAAGSDGSLWLWYLGGEELNGADKASSAQVGRLIATHKTQSRITCLGAFVMDGKQAELPTASAAAEAEKSEIDDDSD
ncbi:hypothetical protein AMS68_005623 [Peltaster fructicola]|uniref:Uncharacterized protein n=1 Tax=Peltaster fructicola TaxID=286661 RepID=A0A6H0XZJ6_9PEZI|nr:hypothetical protein AMS68_005623 [Peltaster fructicola]